jgi:hypothetical protein
MAPHETKLSEMQHANFTTYSNVQYSHVIEKPECSEELGKIHTDKAVRHFLYLHFTLSSCTDLYFTLWLKSTLHNAD